MSHQISFLRRHGRCRPQAVAGRLGLLPAIVVLGGLSLAACTYAQKNVIKPGVLSPTLAPMVFKEEGALVLMTAGVNATRFHGDDPFIPLEVWLANKGVEPSLKVSRESFYLMDTFGKRYGMAGVEEVLRLQRGLSLDRQLNSASFTGSKFDGYRLIPTAFFPILGATIINDRAELPKFAYMADIFYFPRPDGDLGGGIFELHLLAKELPQDIFVVFEVPPR